MTATASVSNQVAEQGFRVLPGVLSADEAAELHAAFDEHEPPLAGANERRLLADPRFARVVTLPSIVDAVREVIGDDLQLLSYDALETRPGKGPGRAWHADFETRIPATVCVNVGIYLNDMTDEMGPLRVVPGSHRWDRGPHADEEHAEFPEEISVSVSAGDAVLFDAQLWHTGGPNAGTRPRRAVFAYYGHFWMKRMDDFFRTPLPPEIRDSSDPLVRQLFGLELDAPSVHGADYHAGNARWH